MAESRIADMIDYNTKIGDNRPSLTTILTQEDGTPIDLTGSTVKLLLKHEENGTKLNFTCTLLAPTLGTLKYDWIIGDIAVPGKYLAEFEITYGNGNKQTVPNSGFYSVIVNLDLNT